MAHLATRPALPEEHRGASTTRSETTSTSRAKGEHAMSPSASDRPPSADDDYAVVREFSRELKIACDDLYCDPFDNDAREALRTLLAERGPIADEALDRLSAQSSTPAVPAVVSPRRSRGVAQ